MKIIMFMGVLGNNNVELAQLVKSKYYMDAIIIDNKNVRKKHKDLPFNHPIIYFDFVKQIKLEINKYRPEIIILIAPFILKNTREIIYEAFPKFEYYGIWVERKREDLILESQLSLECYRPTINEIDYGLKYKVSPTKDEPFKDIIYISREINTSISRNYPYITDIETALLRL